MNFQMTQIGEEDMITLSDKLWNIICKINTDVNKDTRYKSDMSLYEKADYWEPSSSNPKHQGDCEDYALEKRKRLISTGEFDYSSVRLATCWVEGENGEAGKGGYHAVLIVVTDEGDFCLDNRAEDPMLWNKFPYKWHMALIYDEETGESKWREIK
jgi:predicted transglutaminase-like cysteine proteinase